MRATSDGWVSKPLAPVATQSGLLAGPPSPAPRPRPRRWPVWAIAAVLLAPATHAAARHLVFDHLSVEDDRSDVLASAVVKNSRGFLWIGTKNGPDRYDGQRIVPYGSERGYTGGSVNRLYEDREQRLWIGGSDGLYRFDRNMDRVVRVAMPAGINGDQVRDLAEDGNGNL
jgi:ligand-binding sensor domain-containing protein